MPSSPLPTPHVQADPAIAAQTERLAGLPLEDAHAICDAEVARAVCAWRIADATEWQRVKFRLRWLRALRARGAAAETVA